MVQPFCWRLKISIDPPSLKTAASTSKPVEHSFFVTPIADEHDNAVLAPGTCGDDPPGTRVPASHPFPEAATGRGVFGSSFKSFDFEDSRHHRSFPRDVRWQQSLHPFQQQRQVSAGQGQDLTNFSQLVK